VKAPPFSDPDVKAVFDAYPAPLRGRLLKLRQIIFAAAAETTGVGGLIETLKWRQPAYLPLKRRQGSTIRIDALKGSERGYATYFHCQTTLVATFRELYPMELMFEGNRAIVFSIDNEIPAGALRHCIALALTYHSRQRTTGDESVDDRLGAERANVSR
jgi:hypothetical protein